MRAAETILVPLIVAVFLAIISTSPVFWLRQKNSSKAIDTTKARVQLYEASPRVLGTYSEESSVGKVVYKGKSEEKEFLFSKFPNPKFCRKNPDQDLVKGDKRIMPTIRVGTDGGLQAAVVTVRDIEDQVFIDGFKGTDHVAEFCEWLPFTGVVVNKKNFHVENHDADPDDPGPNGDFPGKKGVLPNPHAFEQLGPRSTSIFNIALAEKGLEARQVGRVA
jgi:hypothetical protein